MKFEFSTKVNHLKPSAIREILKNNSGSDIIPFAAGNPAGESFPIEKMAALSASIFEDHKAAISSLQYGITEGYMPLREKLKARMKEKFKVGRDFDDLIITSGGQQVLDLACKVLCNEGDVIISEDPAFIGALNTFRGYNTRLVGAKMEDDGVDLNYFENLLKTEKNIKLFYTIPSFQNPLGTCTSFEKRVRILELCKKYDVIILEDNPYGELRFSGEEIPTIKSMDEEGRVIYAGSLSKVFSAGMRIGFAVGHGDIISKMVVAKQSSDVHTNLFFQTLISDFLEKYDFDEHIEGLKKIYARKSGLMINAIDSYFPKEVKSTRPEGGLFLWCTLPKGSAVDFARLAVSKGVAVVPGNAFSVVEGLDSPSFRLNYSTPSDEQIERGVKILGGLLTVNS